MIPTKTIEELIFKHSTLEKDLSSGEIDKKLFAEKSKEYADVNEIIENAKKYLSYEDDKKDLEKILDDNSSDKELKDIDSILIKIKDLLVHNWLIFWSVSLMIMNNLNLFIGYRIE